MHFCPSLGISYMDIFLLSVLLCFRYVLRNSDYPGPPCTFSSKGLLVKTCHMGKTKGDKGQILLSSLKIIIGWHTFKDIMFAIHFPDKTHRKEI